MTRASRPRRTASSLHGFTLMELMVVCVIIGVALLFVPVNFETFGARSRLSSAANTLLAQLTATREQATMDGYESRLEIGYFPYGDAKRVGVRFWYTNVPPKGAEKAVEDEDRARERATSRAEDRQWLTSSWKAFPEGVKVAGISLEAGQWEKLSEGERTFQIRYQPDGSVERGFAVRLESEDIETKQEARTLTVLVNPLTAEAASYEGFQELPRQRESSEFK